MRTISREGDYTVLSLTIHWEFSSLCGGAGHGIGKYICSLKTERTLFLIRKQQSFASLVSGATPWLAPPASWKRTESGLGVGMVGKSGREISEICSLVTGCKIGQGSRLVARWIERDTCSAGKDGEAGSIIDVEKKFDTLWMAEHIEPLTFVVWWHQFWILGIHARYVDEKIFSLSMFRISKEGVIYALTFYYSFCKPYIQCLITHWPTERNS